jgi:hypothetical protein
LSQKNGINNYTELYYENNILSQNLINNYYKEDIIINQLRNKIQEAQYGDDQLK